MDKEGKVRHSSVNDLGIGRSVDECLRLVRAIQFNDKHGEGMHAIVSGFHFAFPQFAQQSGVKGERRSSLVQGSPLIWMPSAHPIMLAGNRMRQKWMICVILHLTRSTRASSCPICINAIEYHWSFVVVYWFTCIVSFRFPLSTSSNSSSSIHDNSTVSYT